MKQCALQKHRRATCAWLKHTLKVIDDRGNAWGKWMECVLWLAFAFTVCDPRRHREPPIFNEDQPKWPFMRPLVACASLFLPTKGRYATSSGPS